MALNEPHLSVFVAFGFVKIEVCYVHALSLPDDDDDDISHYSLRMRYTKLTTTNLPEPHVISSQVITVCAYLISAKRL
jgi:hypothetical protein